MKSVFSIRTVLKKNVLPVVLAAILFHAFAFSQTRPAENVVFQSLTINDGLSQGMVNKILQDRYGFMWFATKDGLNQYDGYHFKVFRHDADDMTSLADNYVQTITQDSKGRLWVGTSSGYLDIFHHENEKFEHIKLQSKEDQQRPGPIYQITEDGHGQVWVLCNNKLFIIRINDGEDETSSYWVKELSLPSWSTDGSLLVSGNGTVYFTDASKPLIYVLNRHSNEWLLFPAINKFLAANKTHQPARIYGLLEDTTAKKLYAFSTIGVIRFDTVSAPELISSDSMLLTYRQFFLDHDRNVWFVQGYKLGIFNIDSRQTRYLTSAKEEDQVKTGMIHSMFMDESGMVWMGTKGYGLMTLDTRAQKFHHKDNTSVAMFMETSDGKVGVNDGWFQFKVLDASTGNYVDSIPVTKAKVYFDHFNEFSYPLLKDSRQLLWFADDKRLASYNKITKQAISYPLPVMLRSRNYELVSDIKEDPAGNIWIGTTEGVLYFNVAGNKWKIYINDPGNKASISFNAVFSLCFDPVNPGKYLWIGTNGGGLNCMDVTTGKCIRYSVKNGLPNNVVYGILPDDDGNLWMSTNNGLSCFNHQTRTFRNYEDKDGLQSNEFNHNAYLRSKDGLLFFGGVNGYNYFYPYEIAQNPVVPKIVITDFKLRNESVTANQKNSPLKAVPYLTKKIVLPYSDDMLTFEFAALDFTAPDKNMYQYKMEGFDKNWVNSGNIHSATYTNLNPGTYTFIVKGSNKDGVWNKQGASIQLTIRPPWYMTWWFKILVAVAVLTAGYVFYKYRLNKALELQNIRNRIASDLHDEIGSNLSNISIFSKVAQQRKPESPQIPALLGKISEYTQTSMEAMNDIVWMINAQNDRFENIVVRMRTLASELFEATDCDLHIEFDEKLNHIKLDMDKRKNFYLIFKEALNNIAKYACCKDVWISMRLENKQVVLIIKDNGRGFDPKNVKHGNGLLNMKSRAGTLKGNLKLISSQNNGTDVELSFPV